ncbi:MAG: 3-hydroxyisobutyrate dehydrogenase [Rhodospirillales bacterium]|nr:3-hydroxyisobutyrate dehydrogenase [Rhodospirillales bacterium]
MKKVAIVGLGVMGRPMANNLIAKSYNVVAMDLSARALSQIPGAIAPSAEALEGAEAIITMLPEGKDVQSVYEKIVLPGAPAHSLLIDCSTIDIETTEDLAARAAERGLDMLDAPVSGGPEAAGQGTLSLMVGGSPEAYARAGTLLDDMGAKRSYFGPSGSGQAAKVCHNMIVGITALGVMEGFALADSLGLDLTQFFQLCSGAAAQSWALENRCPIPGVAPATPASNNYAPGFAASLMAKDLRLAKAAAKASGQSTPFGTQAADRFTEFSDAGGGHLDFSAIYTSLREQTERP